MGDPEDPVPGARSVTEGQMRRPPLTECPGQSDPQREPCSGAARAWGTAGGGV